jgi:hypothetical protein
MDINLTTPVAANVSLMLPWYNTLINASAGAIGGFVTGIIGLLGVILTTKYYKNKDEQTHDDERRMERRNAYIQLSSQKKLSQLYLSRFE